MIAFTICARNFFGYMLSLQASLQEHHPGTTFYTVVCDDPAQLDQASLPCELVTLDDLGIPNIDDMIARYNITELNTSLKPFVFSFLFDRHPGEMVVYLDPDILVASPMVELEECIARGADCILTPHLLEPAEFAEMDDRRVLLFGIYNLGFCSLRDTPVVRRVVSWWGRRLETQCTIDLPNGIFVDQKWADLFPAFIAKTTLLRHPGYNVAYWNLSQRRVRPGDEGWTVNGLPLRFFHFSGNTIEDPTVFSRHSSQFRTDNLGELEKLVDSYRDDVHRHGHRYYSTLPYAFPWNGSGEENRHTPAAVSEVRRKAVTQVPHLPVVRASSKSMFDAIRCGMSKIVAERVEIESGTISFDSDVFTLPGYCACCEGSRTFQVGSMFSSRQLPDGRVIPNWREHLNCLDCFLVNRVRASLQILRESHNPAASARIYITERKTRTYEWMATRYPHLQGSEYFGSSYRSGDQVDGIRHEDVEGLSFADNSFDFILTFDVLEHVPHPLKAFDEFWRCLRPDGVLMISVPFASTSEDHVIRAVMHDDGEIEHILEPEIHGNPVDPEGGALCFRYFGWKILEDLRAAGFVEAEVLHYWSRDLRYFGDPQFIMTARKPIHSN